MQADQLVHSIGAVLPALLLTFLPVQVYTWPSGAVYEGTVVCGRREGRGKLSFTRWPSVYEGDFRDGVRHGQGVLYTNLARTSYYRGAWRGGTGQGAEHTAHTANNRTSSGARTGCTLL